jgi:hypothetical protein
MEGGKRKEIENKEARDREELFNIGAFSERTLLSSFPKVYCPCKSGLAMVLVVVDRTNPVFPSNPSHGFFRLLRSTLGPQENAPKPLTFLYLNFSLFKSDFGRLRTFRGLTLAIFSRFFPVSYWWFEHKHEKVDPIFKLLAKIQSRGIEFRENAHNPLSLPFLPSIPV